MTIKECIDIVDNAKPNQYGIKEKVMWLSFVDETIINDVLKTHEGYDGRYDNFEGYTEDKLSVPLIVPSPYDRLYPQYIKMMIDSENGETARYNNSSALYNTYLNEYKKYYNKTHMPINATQKIPSPVSININSHLSDAQIEYIKRQLYYMLSEDFSEATSRDKLYDIVTNYVLNNLEMIRANDGKDGKDGEKGTTIHTVENFGLGKTTHVGMYFVNNKKGAGNGTIYKDFTMPKGFVHGDLLFDGKNGLMFDHDYREYSYTKDDVTYFETYDAILCIANLNGKDAVVDQELDWNSENAIANKTVAMKVDEISSVMSAIEGTSARTDLSNVSNEDFRAKAEEAGVGGDNAELLGDAPMVFKGVVSELPSSANEGEVYKPKSDYVVEKQYNNPDNFSYSVEYIGESHVVMSGNLMGYFHEAYESSTSKSGYLMFDNGEYWEEFYFIIANVNDSVVDFANADQSELERVFSSPVECFAIQDVLIVHKGTSAVYHNGEWVEL